MNTLMRYSNYLILCLLTAIAAVPATTWAHGYVGYPIDRQANCKRTGEPWSGVIHDDGCRAASAIYQTNDDKAYPFDQFHEFSINTESATTPIDQILAQLKPGMVCSANSPRKESMSVPTSKWKKTPLISGSPLDIKLLMTAVHTPSRAFVFITKPGFNSATTQVSASDLIPLGSVHPITASDVKPPQLGDIPTGLWASGVVILPTTLPNGQNGPAVIVVIWARDDDKGETFIMCADVTLNGGSVPVKNYLIGPFVDLATRTVKPGDQIRHRVISDGKDVSDQQVMLTSNNLAPGQWSKQLKDRITNPDIEIGEDQNGTIVFNEVDPLANHVYYSKPDAMQNMTIIDGNGENPGVNPTAPVAKFTGPTEATEDETVTFDGRGSIGHNGPLTYSWVTNAAGGVSPPNNASTFGFRVGPYVAPIAGSPEPKYIVKLGVYDNKNRKNDQTEIEFTIKKRDIGGEYPAWKLNGGYNSGSKVSNYGKRFECVPGSAGAWCGQNENEPGKPGSNNWQRAWDVVP